jgi:lipoate---protein ligase
MQSENQRHQTSRYTEANRFRVTFRGLVMLFGECKVAGGKLVQVQLNIVNGLLQRVQLRGDFFLQPESATLSTIQAIGQALENCPADLPLAALQSRIQAAIPYPVELIGTSPEAMAIAIQRAITGQVDLHEATPLERVGTFSTSEVAHFTSRWKDVSWTVIAEEPQTAAMNVALDEVLTDQVAQGQRGATLRFWRWTEPAVIIGRTQSISNEVDQQAAQERGIRVVRRLTGGGAMFLQPHGAITYSLYLPEKLLSGLTIRQSYEVCDAWVTLGLRELGCEAYYVPINDIACSEGKIGGAAQARRNGVVLHHTTIAYDMDPGEMLQVLRIGREKLRDKGTASAAKRVSPLVRQTGLRREEIVRSLQESFLKQFGGQLETVQRDELTSASSLVSTKYANRIWTEEFL